MSELPATWPPIQSLLALWDTWCPDDGRPARLMHVAGQYAQGRATEATFQGAIAAAWSAWLMAYDADPQEDFALAPASPAQRAGDAIFLLTAFAVRFKAGRSIEAALHAMCAQEEWTLLQPYLPSVPRG